MRLNKPKLRAILACIYILVIIQCNHTKGSIIGTFIINARGQKDSLFIHENHTFFQHYADSKGNFFINEGTWNLTDSKIEFNDFVWYLPGYGPKNRRKVLWIAAYHTSLTGETVISVDDDLEIEYSMIKKN